MSPFWLKAQNDTVEIVFEEYYEIREGQNAEKYYSILFDSTYYQHKNLTFLRACLNFAFESIVSKYCSEQGVMKELSLSLAT